MRLIFDKGLRAVAENFKDVQTLMSLESGQSTSGRNKRAYKKACPQCDGRYVKVNMHIAKAHKAKAE